MQITTSLSGIRTRGEKTDCGLLGVKQTLCQQRKIRDCSQSWNTSVELTLQLHLIEKNDELLGLMENLPCDWNNTKMNNFKQNETYIIAL